MKYNWQQPDWRHFSYDLAELEEVLYQFAGQMGHLSGVLKALPEDARIEAIVDTMVAEAVKTSEIEGEYLGRQDVKSSIRNGLGLNPTFEKVQDRRAQGAAELMVDVRKTFDEPMTKEMLFHWHQMLLSQSNEIAVGTWRTHEEPMQVISGPMGKERVHFEAPPSREIPRYMTQFITWFNDTAPGGPHQIKKAPVRAAIAHLYFESIHPFEDGNGRIGRAISEKVLSQGLGQPVLLSLSKTIHAKKNEYYAALENAQRSNEITPWLTYFIKTIIGAQNAAAEQVDFILHKARFFDQYRSELNDRQLMVVRRMLDEGPEGFEGGMSARKYMAIAKTSKATATRDMYQLVELGMFRPVGSGRSSRYDLILS